MQCVIKRFSLCVICCLVVCILPSLAFCSELTPSSQESCRSSDFPAAYAKLSEVSPLALSAAWPSERWLEVRCMIDSLDSIAQAEALRWDYVTLRENPYPLSGYKLALASPRAQALFGLDAPVLGAFFSDTLLPNNSEVSLSAAENIAYEPDFLVRVGSEDINRATTVAQLAPHIDSVAAFLELPDLLFPAAPGSGLAFIASNAAVRYGVVGDWLEARDDADFLAMLADMEVVVSDASGRVLSRAKGRALMGHPYHALLALLEQLRQQSRWLRVGDVVSLGAFAPPRPVGDLRQLRVDYHGLVDHNGGRAKEKGDNKSSSQSLSVAVRFIAAE